MTDCFRWYSFRTSDNNLANRLSTYLKNTSTQYERSGGNGFWWFSIYANQTLAARIDEFINKQ